MSLCAGPLPVAQRLRPAWRPPLTRSSAEAADDPIGVEVLPARRRCRFRESPFGLDQLVYEVTTGRGPPEGLGKLGVIDEPVCIERGPIVVCTVCDAIHDVVDLAGLVE